MNSAASPPTFLARVRVENAGGIRCGVVRLGVEILLVR